MALLIFTSALLAIMIALRVAAGAARCPNAELLAEWLNKIGGET